MLKIDQKVLRGYTYRIETPSGFQFSDNTEAIRENIYLCLANGNSEEKIGEWFCLQVGKEYIPLKDIKEVGKIVEFKTN